MDTQQPAVSMEDALRRRLIATGCTQVEIAQATGVAQSTVGRFIRAEVHPTMRHFEKLLKFVQHREALADTGMLERPRKGPGAPRGIRAARA